MIISIVIRKYLIKCHAIYILNINLSTRIIRKFLNLMTVSIKINKNVICSDILESFL